MCYVTQFHLTTVTLYYAIFFFILHSTGYTFPRQKAMSSNELSVDDFVATTEEESRVASIAGCSILPFATESRYRPCPMMKVQTKIIQWNISMFQSMIAM